MSTDRNKTRRGLPVKFKFLKALCFASQYQPLYLIPSISCSPCPEALDQEVLSWCFLLLPLWPTGTAPCSSVLWQGHHNRPRFVLACPTVLCYLMLWCDIWTLHCIALHCKLCSIVRLQTWRVHRFTSSMQYCNMLTWLVWYLGQILLICCLWWSCSYWYTSHILHIWIFHFMKKLQI